LNKNPVCENCSHPLPCYFSAIFDANDDGLLAQGKEDKAKRDKKSRQWAARGRIVLPYPRM